MAPPMAPARITLEPLMGAAADDTTLLMGQARSGLGTDPVAARGARREARHRTQATSAVHMAGTQDPYVSLSPIVSTVAGGATVGGVDIPVALPGEQREGGCRTSGLSTIERRAESAVPLVGNGYDKANPGHTIESGVIDGGIACGGGSDAYARPTTRRQKPLSLENYDGSTQLETFLAKFRNCARYNGWDADDRAAFLRDSLQGNASQVLWEISDDSTDEQILKLLRNQFGNMN